MAGPSCVCAESLFEGINGPRRVYLAGAFIASFTVWVLFVSFTAGPAFLIESSSSIFLSPSVLIKNPSHFSEHTFDYAAMLHIYNHFIKSLDKVS